MPRAKKFKGYVGDKDAKPGGLYRRRAKCKKCHKDWVFRRTHGQFCSPACRQSARRGRTGMERYTQINSRLSKEKLRIARERQGQDPFVSRVEERSSLSIKMGKLRRDAFDADSLPSPQSATQPKHENNEAQSNESE